MGWRDLWHLAQDDDGDQIWVRFTDLHTAVLHLELDRERARLVVRRKPAFSHTRMLPDPAVRMTAQGHAAIDHMVDLQTTTIV